MIEQIRHEPPYKQLWLKMNQTSFLCRNHNRHHNVELKALRHIILQNVQHDHTKQSLLIFALNMQIKLN